MKKMKRVLAAFVMVCMLSTWLPITANAASAELRFTDPSTTVGAEVEVTAKLTSSSNLQSLNATLTYDTDMLRFISGDDATGGEGTVTLNGSGSSTTMEFVLKFQALAEGTAAIEISQASGTDASGGTLQITKGSSKVEIGPGDPSLIQDEGEADSSANANGAQVEVDGVQYIITSGFSDAVIPEGFTKGELQFEGATCEVVTQEASGVSAMYLTPAAGGESDFFLYDSDKGTFSPFEEVEIAQGRYLVPMRHEGKVNLPKQYEETKFTLNDKEFTAWQDMDNPEFYIIYALNSDGQKEYYQYDTKDNTYQRYVKQTASADTADTSSPKGIWGKILNFINDFLDIAVILFAAVLLILIVILIVVAVKLRHRNLELDDLYDEYGIDLEEEETVPVKGKKKQAAANGEPAVRKPAKQVRIEDEDDFDDFEDYEEEDFDDYGAEEEYEDYDDGYEDYDSDDDYDDELIDDLDDLLSNQPKKKRGHMEEDDTFKVDFIDID